MFARDKKYVKMRHTLVFTSFGRERIKATRCTPHATDTQANTFSHVSPFLDQNTSKLSHTARHLLLRHFQHRCAIGRESTSFRRLGRCRVASHLCSPRRPSCSGTCTFRTRCRCPRRSFGGETTRPTLSADLKSSCNYRLQSNYMHRTTAHTRSAYGLCLL